MICAFITTLRASDRERATEREREQERERGSDDTHWQVFTTIYSQTWDSTIPHSGRWDYGYKVFPITFIHRKSPAVTLFKDHQSYCMWYNQNSLGTADKFPSIGHITPENTLNSVMFLAGVSVETVATMWLNKVSKGQREREARVEESVCAGACVCVCVRESGMCVSVWCVCACYGIVYRHTPKWYYVKCGRGAMFCGLLTNCIVSVDRKAASSHSPARPQSRSTAVAVQNSPTAPRVRLANPRDLICTLMSCRPIRQTISICH